MDRVPFDTFRKEEQEMSERTQDSLTEQDEFDFSSERGVLSDKVVESQTEETILATIEESLTSNGQLTIYSFPRHDWETLKQVVKELIARENTDEAWRKDPTRRAKLNLLLKAFDKDAEAEEEMDRKDRFQLH